MSDDNALVLAESFDADVPVAADDLARVRTYAAASKSSSTKRAYSSAWHVFTTWCEVQGYEPLPAHPVVVAAFVTDQARDKAVSTVEKYMAAIGEAHRITRQADVPTESPEVCVVMKGVRRTHRTAQKGKSALLVSHLRRISESLPDGLLGVRDRALLLLGFAAASRRSELVGLDVEDLEFRDEGLVVTIRRSKTDQEGAGRLAGIPFGSTPATCPVRAVRSWLRESGVEHGPLFRSVDRHGRMSDARLSGKAVGLVVKRGVAAIGLDPDEFGGHSLRAGLATEAARAGAGEIAIMKQTGHRSLATLRGYVRHGTLFVQNAAALVGL